MTEKPVKVDHSLWSDKSQRSYSCLDEYRDLEYLCIRCQAPDVFSAAQQKYVYEVLKKHIHTVRVLCHHCYRQKLVNETDLKRYAEDWEGRRPVLQHDVEFLSGWLQAMEEKLCYGGRVDVNRFRMLQKLIVSLT